MRGLARARPRRRPIASRISAASIAAFSVGLAACARTDQASDTANAPTSAASKSHACNVTGSIVSVDFFFSEGIAWLELAPGDTSLEGTSSKSVSNLSTAHIVRSATHLTVSAVDLVTDVRSLKSKLSSRLPTLIVVATSPRRNTAMLMIQPSNMGALHVLGHCADNLYGEQLREAISRLNERATGSEDEGSYRALVRSLETGRPYAVEELVRELGHPAPQPTVESWRASDPARRVISLEMTPLEVLNNYYVATVWLSIPQDWRTIEFTLCSRTPAAWSGTCAASSAAHDGELLPLTVAFQPGDTVDVYVCDSTLTVEAPLTRLVSITPKSDMLITIAAASQSAKDIDSLVALIGDPEFAGSIQTTELPAKPVPASQFRPGT